MNWEGSQNFWNEARSFWGEAFAWTIAFAHAGRRGLRGERELPEVAALLGPGRAARVAAAAHMPSAVSRRIGALLRQAYASGALDGLAFSEAEGQRTRLIEHIGDCERILATPLPRAYSIEIRRSIVVFLVTLTFALLSKDLGWVTLPVTMLVAYAVLSLDLIGSALQNPFAPHNLGALTLDDICRSIEGELLGLLAEERGLPEEREETLDLVPDAAGGPDPGGPPSFPPPEAPSRIGAAATIDASVIDGGRHGEEQDQLVYLKA